MKINVIDQSEEVSIPVRKCGGCFDPSCDDGVIL